VTGTILNIITVLIGGALGILFGSSLPDRIRTTVVAGLGLFTAAYGLLLFTRTENPIVVLGSLLLGGVLGEWLRIEDGLRGLGAFLEARFISQPRDRNPMKHQQGFEVANGELDEENVLFHAHPEGGSRFVRGFLTASLVFCVGPMTILGSIQDGLTGDYSTLAIKSVLDGFAALAFASTLGIGVLFSTFVILGYQGSLSLLAAQAQNIITSEMMLEMTAVGGVLLIGIAVSNLLEIKPIRVGNFLPALLLAPLILLIFAYFG
jgi:uncharacterized protein